jgi:hypothetical protein
MLGRLPTTTRNARPTLIVGSLLAAWAMLVLTGCTKPLLTPEEPRSQYDRYDQIRAQRSPSYLEDEYGRRRPNLRGRLLAKD